MDRLFWFWATLLWFTSLLVTCILAKEQSSLPPPQHFSSSTLEQNLTTNLAKRDVYNLNNLAQAEAFTMNRSCSTNHDCVLDNRTETGICENGICQKHLFFNATQNNETSSNRRKAKSHNKGLHMLPIMIIMGIMFAGICVAMNLFSRARFRNSRSIFSNPRLLKLANANSNNQSQASRPRRKFLPNSNRRKKSKLSSRANDQVAPTTTDIECHDQSTVATVVDVIEQLDELSQTPINNSV